MIKQRTNQEWLWALTQPAGKPARREALLDLRRYLQSVALIYLRDGRTDLSDESWDTLYQWSEDVAQEATMAIQDNLDSFRGQAKFTTWAYRFAINEAAGSLRRRRHHTSLDDLSPADEATIELLFQKTMSPENAALEDELLTTLRQLMQDLLTERQRWAIMAVHFRGMSMAEAAAEVDSTVNAFYKLLHDARRKLKAGLIAHDPDRFGA